MAHVPQWPISAGHGCLAHLWPARPSSSEQLLAPHQPVDMLQAALHPLKHRHEAGSQQLGALCAYHRSSWPATHDIGPYSDTWLDGYHMCVTCLYQSTTCSSPIVENARSVTVGAPLAHHARISAMLYSVVRVN